ncbi:DUF4253 domain-containing protein [Streptomyces profundus]|uniref:DUF4253 domain-containing protein n=1 Tax=Streptomyces profundus TaxID=2867410 RepID=UPI001D164BF6|nr:DUF4253 domain-containing protein [Streptomyces sp. MA3_2.13]UED85800.1 DUF4253 domain-containing protein [Streptomyces sp. MA3_2.13]
MTTESNHFVALGIPLPPGRLVTADEGEGDLQPLWLSEGPVSGALWGRLNAAHGKTGVRPLLLEPLEPLEPETPENKECRPWASGELFPTEMSSPDSHDAADLLAGWWREHALPGEEEGMSEEERLSVVAPFGRALPGRAPAGPPIADPDEVAAGCAVFLAEELPELRLGLVETAGSGADALVVAGWSGPMNYDDTGKFAAVLRDWERRFGARVVAVGFDTLYLSVAAPARSFDEALPIAAEHFAFCPDNVWQREGSQTLAAYARDLVGASCWEFWWD